MMYRVLRKGTTLPIDGRLTGITLLADGPVLDAWHSDDHFAGWLFNLGTENMELHASDLRTVERFEEEGGVRYYRVYDRAYGANAVADLQLISSTEVEIPQKALKDREKAITRMGELDREIELLDREINTLVNIEKPDPKLVTKRNKLAEERLKAATDRDAAQQIINNPPKPKVKQSDFVSDTPSRGVFTEGPLEGHVFDANDPNAPIAPLKPGDRQDDPPRRREKLEEGSDEAQRQAEKKSKGRSKPVKPKKP
jgi:hypothetical protein